MEDKTKDEFKSERDSLYRQFIINYWINPKVYDEFTKIDKYLYVYLYTNPHSNLIGCYQIAKKMIADETSISNDEINESLKHLESMGWIKTDKDTNEILLCKYVIDNWTKSPKYIRALSKQYRKIKSKNLISKLIEMLYKTHYHLNTDTLSIEYREDINIVSNPSLKDIDIEIEQESEQERESVSEGEKEKKKKEENRGKGIIKGKTPFSITDSVIEQINDCLNISIDTIKSVYDELKENNFISIYGEFISNTNVFIDYLKMRKEKEINVDDMF